MIEMTGDLTFQMQRIDWKGTPPGFQINPENAVSIGILD
jgi:hypothetical protein